MPGRYWPNFVFSPFEKLAHLHRCAKRSHLCRAPIGAYMKELNDQKIVNFVVNVDNIDHSFDSREDAEQYFKLSKFNGKKAILSVNRAVVKVIITREVLKIWKNNQTLVIMWFLLIVKFCIIQTTIVLQKSVNPILNVVALNVT